MIILTLNHDYDHDYNHKYKSSYIYFHFSVQSIVEEQIVSHAYPVRLHRVTLAIVVIPDIA